MGDPVPVRVAGPRTSVRYYPSTRIPLPSHAATAACLSTSGPPAFRHPPYRALSASPDTTGIAPRPARYVAPRPGSRHAKLFARQARGPSRALAALLAVGGTPPPARYRECGVRCLAMRRRPTMLLRCSGHWRSSLRCFHTPGSSSRQRRLWRPMCAGHHTTASSRWHQRSC